MKLPYNEFLAVVYADLFSFSLTPKEARLWAISEVGSREQKRKDRKINQMKVNEVRGYLTLFKRESLVSLRVRREAISAQKYELAQSVAGVLSKLPTIEAIFLTGSVATKNASDDADIDFMIVTIPRGLWISRMLVVGMLKISHLYRSDTVVKNKFCTNIYVDRNHVTIGEHNLYSAHEVLQAECLVDKSQIENKWIRDNAWTKQFLPRRYNQRWLQTQNTPRKVRRANRTVSRKMVLWILSGVLFPVELTAYVLQVLYMRPKITQEKVHFTSAFFHPQDLSGVIAKKLSDRLRKNLSRSAKIGK